MYIWGGVLTAIALAWLGHRIYLAHENLVSLDVRDADVRDVIKKCEWQTWETIVVHKDVKGKITLNVNKMPLEEVLGIIGEKTSSRATAVYPIFSKSSSIVELRKIARGDLAHESGGWTNFFLLGSGRGRGGPGRGGPGGPGGFGGFGDTARNQNSPVSLSVTAKDLNFAALALARFSNAQVVPEDGADAQITLNLTQVPFTKAVAAVAKGAHRKWDVFYSLQAMPDFFGRDDGPGPRDGEGRRGFRNRDENETNRLARAEQWAAMRDREFEARLATMTPEEQAKAREEQQKMEEMRNLPPDERQQAFQQMANDPRNADNARRFENRMNNAFKYASPEQRVDRARRMADRKQRQQTGGRRY
jgi:hypothetical protein